MVNGVAGCEKERPLGKTQKLPDELLVFNPF